MKIYLNEQKRILRASFINGASLTILFVLAFCFTLVEDASSVELGVGGPHTFSRAIREGNWDFINPILDYMSDSEIKSVRAGFPCTIFLNYSPAQLSILMQNFQVFLDKCDSTGIDVIFTLGAGSGPDYINLYELTGCSSALPDTAVRYKFPPSASAWETYIEGMMDNFGSQITGIEVMNEPDHLEHMFHGRVEDYINLFLIAQEIVKENFPNMPVSTGGLTCGKPIYRSYIAALLNPVTGVYNKCDAFGLHCYSGRALEILRTYKEVCAEMELEPKPVWISEFGRRLDEEPSRASFFSLNGARADFEHTMEIFSSYGVERAIWFCATCESEHGGIGNHSLFDWDEENRTITPNDKWDFYSAAAEKHESYNIGESIGFGSSDGQDLFGVSPFESYQENPTNPEIESAFKFVDENVEYPIRSRVVDSNVMAISFDLNDSWVDDVYTDELVLEIDIRSYGDGAEIELRYQSCCETEFEETNLSTANFDNLICRAFLNGLTLLTTGPDYLMGVDYSENVNTETLAFSPGALTTISVQIDDWMFQNGLARRSDISFVPANANVDSFEIHRIEIHPVTSSPPLYTVEYTDRSTETQLQYSGQPRNAMPLDYNLDGVKDLLITKYDEHSIMNKGRNITSSGVPVFDDFTTSVFPSGNSPESGTNGIVLADFDNDGWVDFFATNPNGASRLYRNMNGGHFADWTTESGLSALLGSDDDICSCSWADYDGDSFLDLTLISGEPVFSGLLKVFHNTGGTFESTTIEGYSGFTPLWADFDNDGDLDLISLQSYEHSLSEPFLDYNIFYINQGDGTFINEAWDRIGSTASYMGYTISVVVDIDNDGDFDIVYAEGGGTVFILENNSFGYFSPPYVTYLTPSGYPTDIAVFDYDLDGFQDVIVGYSSGLDSQSPTLAHLLGNRLSTTGHRLLADETLTAGLTGSSHFAGIAPADYNRDGFSDLYLTRSSNQEFFFKAKPSTSQFQNNWIGLSLQSPNGANNSTGIGARVELTAGPNTYTQVVDGGSGLSSQHEADLVFGLGNYVGWVSAQITWPNGHIQSQGNLRSKQFHSLVDDSPIVDNGTVSFNRVYHVNSGLEDWVFTWETINSSLAALDKIVFDYSGVSETCPPGCPEINEQINGVTVTIIPLGQGRFKHCLTMVDVRCQGRCSIHYTVESSMGGSVSTSASHFIRSKTCFVNP